MSGLKAGDKFPEGVVFRYIPWSREKSSMTSCGLPQDYKATEQFAGKKVVLISTPGAFTPGCSQRHLPGYINSISQLKDKGVDIIAVIAYNDAWVMSAWGKANDVTRDDFLFLSDPATKFSKSIGWVNGERTARYAMVIEDNVIKYAERETGTDVVASSAETVLAKL
ncbi:MAG: hypothetical protein M1813_003931 [Trichoglossum hirsutum]|nr:MAG: hypothetical protein M1813_003931 [Trichoglossum hirsutum]